MPLARGNLVADLPLRRVRVNILQHWNQTANSLVTFSRWKPETESNTLSSLCFLAIYNFIYLYSTLHSLQVKKQFEIWLLLVSQELFERKLVVHFLLHYWKKWFFSEGIDQFKRELKHARFRDANGNRKRTFRVPGQRCLPDFYTNHL